MKSLNEITNVLNEDKANGFVVNHDSDTMKRVKSISKQKGGFSGLPEFDGYRNKQDGTYRFNIDFPNSWVHVKITDENPDTLILGGPAGKVYRTIPLKGTLYNNMSVDRFASDLAKQVEAEDDTAPKVDKKMVSKAIRAYFELMED